MAYRLNAKLSNGQVATGTINNGADFDKMVASLPEGVKLTRVSLKPQDVGGVTIRAPRAKQAAKSASKKK